MLRPRVVCPAFALVLLAVAPPAQAVLIPDSLRETLAVAYPLQGPVVASTPAGDVLVMTASLAPDPEGEVFSPIIGNIRNLEGEHVGGFVLDPGEPAAEGAAAAASKAATATASFAAAGSASGNFLVVWPARSATATGNELVARFFDRHGEPAGALLVLAEPGATRVLGSPAAACNLVTRCVVAWTSQDLSGGAVTVEGRVLDSLSNPDQETFELETATAPGTAPALSVAVASAGHFAVLFTEAVPTVRRFAGTGAPLGGPISLLSPAGPPPASVYKGSGVGAFDEVGNLLAAFSAHHPDGRLLVWAQRFGLTGQPLGAAAPVNETGTGLLPVLVWNHEAERFVVAWHGLVDQHFGNRVLARALDAEGSPEGAEQVVFDPGTSEYTYDRIDLAFLSPTRVGVFWSSTFSPLASTYAHQNLFRLGPGSCADAEPPATRARCVRIGPQQRFQVTAAFRGDLGRSRPADLEALTANAAFLFFRGEENPEVVTKILDGRPINGSFWYFSGAMSNQEYQVTAFDTETGRVASYYNPPALLRSLADTSTFVDAPLADASAAEPVDGELLSLGLSERWAPEPGDLFLGPAAGKAAAGAGCLIPTPTSLCLNQARFRVEVRWTDFAGNTGQATAVQTTADGGYFWFFNPANVELALKILDGRPVNGKFWVFYASLSNVRFVVRIYDESGNQVKVYRNPPRTLASVADTQAF